MKRPPVWPTGRGWLMLGASLASFCNALVNPNLVSFVFFASVCSICISSLLLSVFSLRRLRIERRIGGNGVMGGRVSLPIRVVNEGRLSRQALVVREGAGFTDDPHFDVVVDPMLPGEDRETARSPLAVRRGRYKLKEILAIGGDPAGLFRRVRSFDIPDETVIRPERVKLAWMPIRIKGRIQASSSGRNAGSAGFGQDFFGVREYRPSDGVRFIHWKASAKQGGLMVREFEEQNIAQVTVILDNCRKDVGEDKSENNFETLVKIAASMSDYLGGLYCRMAFVSGPSGDDKGDIICETGYAFGLRRLLLETLTDIRPGGMSLVELLDSSMNLIPPGSLLYILSMSSPEGVEARIGSLMDRNIEVRWIMAPKELFPERVDGMPQAHAHQANASKEENERQQRWREGCIQPVLCGPKTNLASLLSYG